MYRSRIKISCIWVKEQTYTVWGQWFLFSGFIFHIAQNWEVIKNKNKIEKMTVQKRAYKVSTQSKKKIYSAFRTEKTYIKINALKWTVLRSNYILSGTVETKVFHFVILDELLNKLSPVTQACQQVQMSLQSFIQTVSSSPVTGLEWPRGFQEVKVPRFHVNGKGWW